MAVRAEAAGFDSFWTTDFALGDSPDPLPLLAAASQRTQRILLGTAVMVLPYRHPLLLAKAAAATVDALTNGRLILGLGVGSNKREFDALGLDIHERGKMADEKLMLLRKLLSGEKVSHKGKYHQFDGVDVGPETATEAPPPDLDGPAVEERVGGVDHRKGGQDGGRLCPDPGPRIGIQVGAGKGEGLRPGRETGPGRHRVRHRALVLPGRRTGRRRGRRWKRNRTVGGAIRRRCVGRRTCRVGRRTVRKGSRSTWMLGSPTS